MLRTAIAAGAVLVVAGGVFALSTSHEASAAPAARSASTAATPGYSGAYFHW
jgi:hypothetical protein